MHAIASRQSAPHLSADVRKYYLQGKAGKSFPFLVDWNLGRGYNRVIVQERSKCFDG